MITSLQLENWKSYEKANLDIDSLTILIGTNASGKSNALDSLTFLNRISSGIFLSTTLQGDGAISPLRGGTEWAARRPGNTFSIGVTCRADDLTDYEYRIKCSILENKCEVIEESLTRNKFRLDKSGTRRSVTGTIKLFRTDPCEDHSPHIVTRFYNGKQGTPRTLGRSQCVIAQVAGQKLGQETQEGVNEVLGNLREIFLLDPIPSHMRNYQPLSEKLESDAKNIAGIIAALPDTKRLEIEETLTEYAGKLPERDIRRVYAETVGKFKSDAMLYCEEEWVESGSTHTIDARGMSDGTLRFLAILTALLTRPTGSLLVIEEIDNGLHPSRSNMLLGMLKKVGQERGVDVLATTHNPALLDAMGTEMIPFISVAFRDHETGFSRLILLENIKQLPRLLSEGTVGKLSSRGLIEKSLQRSLNFDSNEE